MNIRTRRWGVSFSILMAVTWLTSLCTGVALAQDVAGAPPVATAFKLIDERPAQDRKYRMLSVWLWSCNFAITNFGDGGQAGTKRVADLEALLATTAARFPVAPTIVLKKYNLLVNGNAREMAESWKAGVGPGLISGAIGEGKVHKPKCAREKMAAGWFDPSEITNGNSPVVVEIALSVNGKPIAVRKVLSPAKELMKDTFVKPMEPDEIAAIEALLHDANELAVQQVSTVLSQ
jgi:hypothetical protein